MTPGRTSGASGTPAEQRRFRDAHSVSQQVQGRLSHFESVGQHILGLPANQRFI